MRTKQRIKPMVFVALLVVGVFLVSAIIPTMVLARPGILYENGARTDTPARSRVWNDDMLSERRLNRRIYGLDILNPVPDMTPAFGEGYVLINQQINEVVTQIINEASRVRARGVAFDFDHHVSGDVVSIVIYADVSATPQRMLVRSVNFSLNDGRVLSMNEAMGEKIVPLTERLLVERIRRDPARYYAALYAPLESQAFFVTDAELVLLFDGLRLSSAYGGIDSIRLTRRNIRVTTIARSDYRVHINGYRLMFIPAGDVVKALGYEAVWVGEDNRVDIRRNNRTIIQFWPGSPYSPGENRYVLAGAAQPRTLEAAPRMYNNRAYVPITFFEQLLPLTTYSICPDAGSITFLAYLE
ncbi:MAG: copper amine oxidase N-terminal domain-containing protein [Defluviitaleaceae bacterium]|nr:copper amine oxidase N-terminal domain-containing protein [Defluviitaleaceae bacterium]